MWKLKNCPKCSGDVWTDHDYSGDYEECLQCGYVHYLHTEVVIPKARRRQNNVIETAASRYAMVS